jgi:hypothetical protein
MNDKPRTKFCSYSNDVQLHNKWGRQGEIVKCRNCGRMVKMRRAVNGSVGVYVQVPRHKMPAA